MMEIQKISPQEINEVNAIIEKEFSYLKMPTQKLKDRSNDPNVFIFTARIQSELAGFIDLSITYNIAMLNGFGVKENFRKRGIGKKLLQFGINFLKEIGVEQVRLLLKKENTIEKKLYKKTA